FQATLPDGRGHIRLGLFDLPLAHRDSAAWLGAVARPDGAARSLRRDTPPTGPQAYLARRSETTARERDPGRLPAVGQTPEEITPADAVRQRKLLPRPRGGVVRLLRTTGSVRDVAPAVGKLRNRRRAPQPRGGNAGRPPRERARAVPRDAGSRARRVSQERVLRSRDAPRSVPALASSSHLHRGAHR